MTIALAMTVRNEEELLRANLLYHHYLGVERCFVYADGCTDGTVASVAPLPFVDVLPSAAPGTAAPAPELAHATAHLASHVTARQVVNTADALRRAAAAGCDWLLSLDADELACPDLCAAAPGGLRARLDGVPADVACVRFPVLEVVQQGREYANVFAEATLFKHPTRRLRRRVRDPVRGGAVTAEGFYGHVEGKSAVRVSARAVPRTPHRFLAADGGTLATVTAGHLLHYYCYSASAFLAKFRRFSDHPDTHLWQAPVEPLKRLWRDVVNHPGLTADDVRAYYRRWVAFDDRRVRRLRRSTWLGVIAQTPAVTEVTAPRRVFEALARADARGST